MAILEPKRLRLALGHPLNQYHFVLRWPDGRIESDRHLAPLACYVPPDQRPDPAFQLQQPTPELLASLSDDDKTRYLGACAFAKKIQVQPPSNLVTDAPRGS